MCEIEAIQGVKKKANPVAAKMAQMAQAAEDKMMVYEQVKAKLMKEGLSAPEAGKAAQKHIDQMFGSGANAGGKTNNDKEAFVDKSKQQNERVLGETNMKGELKTLVDASEDANGSEKDSSGNNSNSRPRDLIKMESNSLPKGKAASQGVSLFDD